MESNAALIRPKVTSMGQVVGERELLDLPLDGRNFLIDGADNVNAVDSGFVLKPPIDAIAEFRILTHNADAQFGRNIGSTTNIITRSGTNAFHGAAWEFLRNDAMDASDY